MTTGSPVTLTPRWMQSVGALFRTNALVRSRCQDCGALMRVDLAEMVATYGAMTNLFDRFDRCRMVACSGSVFYMASRSFGREWTTLLRDAKLATDFADLPPVQTAAELVGRRRF